MSAPEGGAGETSAVRQAPFATNGVGNGIETVCAAGTKARNQVPTTVRVPVAQVAPTPGFSVRILTSNGWVPSLENVKLVTWNTWLIANGPANESSTFVGERWTSPHRGFAGATGTALTAPLTV